MSAFVSAWGDSCCFPPVQGILTACCVRCQVSGAGECAEKMKHIVLVEDDDELRSLLVGFLRRQGLRVDACRCFAEMQEIFEQELPDLLLLDLMLPGKNGIDILRHIRQQHSMPVLMLTAQESEQFEISALNAGAVSYLKKPIRPHVLLAHITALLRQAEYGSPSDSRLCSTAQGLCIDDVSLTATHRGQPLHLSTAEFELLNLLYRHRGRPVSRDFIMQNVRGMEYDGLNRSVDMRISTLRRKLGDSKPPYLFIKTVRGKGYLFADSADDG